ncbi:MAG: aminoacyl-tRNA hydrolase [Candidatus Gracilibacteria bacterium]
MVLIVGLGNPGKEYEKTRHNAGFLAIEALRERLKFGTFRNEAKFKAEVSRGEFNGEKVILMRPQTFMNLSGEAVQAVKSYYKINNEDVWVVLDDIDLPLGTLRIRAEGSAGTHNGMKSLVQTLSTEKFPRFRLGIESRGVIAPAEQDLTHFVLEPFRNEEFPEFERLVERFTEAVVLALKKGLPEAMQQFSA